MSFYAIRWAFSQSVKKSTTKFVLVNLAYRTKAIPPFEVWPSMKCICEDTKLDIKTVERAIKELLALRLIKDTGKRTGKTKQVAIYALLISEEYQNEHPIKKLSTKGGKLGGVQNLNTPKFPGNTPKFPIETPPNLGDGILIRKVKGNITPAYDDNLIKIGEDTQSLGMVEFKKLKQTLESSES